MTYTCITSSTHRSRNAEQTHNVFSEYFLLLFYKTTTRRCVIVKERMGIFVVSCRNDTQHTCLVRYPSSHTKISFIDERRYFTHFQANLENLPQPISNQTGELRGLITWPRNNYENIMDAHTRCSVTAEVPACLSKTSQRDRDVNVVGTDSDLTLTSAMHTLTRTSKRTALHKTQGRQMKLQFPQCI